MKLESSLRSPASLAPHTRSPVGRPAFCLAAQRNPRVVENKMTTTKMQIGAIKLLEQVNVEILVSRLNTSKHQPSLYPFIAVLGSEVAVGVVSALMAVGMVEEMVKFMVLFRVAGQVEEKMESRVLLRVVGHVE